MQLRNDHWLLPERCVTGCVAAMRKITVRDVMTLLPGFAPVGAVRLFS
jgi:hypothetical protein